MLRFGLAVLGLLFAGCLDTNGTVDGGPDLGPDPCAYDPVNGYSFDCPLVLDDVHVTGLDPSTLPMGTHPCAAPQLALVKRVVDGDTFRVDFVGSPRVDVDIRIIGVNCPEIMHPPNPTPAECYGDAAATFTRDALVGHQVWLTFGETCIDPYMRTLAFVNLGPLPNDSLERQLMRRGFARIYTFSDNPDFASTYMSDQDAAMSASVGLWGACP